jgi:hypothetical protein
VPDVLVLRPGESYHLQEGDRFCLVPGQAQTFEVLRNYKGEERIRLVLFYFVLGCLLCYGFLFNILLFFVNIEFHPCSFKGATNINSNDRPRASNKKSEVEKKSANTMHATEGGGGKKEVKSFADIKRKALETLGETQAVTKKRKVVDENRYVSVYCFLSFPSFLLLLFLLFLFRLTMLEMTTTRISSAISMWTNSKSCRTNRMRIVSRL